MKAVFTEAAQRDLAEVARHIGKDSIGAARRFTAQLRSRAHAIGRNPRLHPIAAGLEEIGVRRRVYRGYLILILNRMGGRRSSASFMEQEIWLNFCLRRNGKTGQSSISERLASSEHNQTRF